MPPPDSGSQPLIQCRAPRRERTQPAAEEAGHAWPRVGAAFALCVGYAGVLVSRIPFQFATFLFILAFILTFELWDGNLRARWLRPTIVAVLIAGLISFGIGYDYLTDEDLAFEGRRPVR